MKKIISAIIAVIMLFSSVSVLAVEYEEFSFADIPYVTEPDEAVLMEVDVQTELETRLVQAWKNFETEVDIADLKISKNDISKMYGKVWHENPLYFYVERSFNGTTNAAGQMGAVKPRYSMDEEAVKEIWAKIDEAAEEILLYINPYMTDLEKILAVHDYMALNYEYVLEKNDQTMLTMFLEKGGVCAGYAKSFLHMMNVLGINCTVVEGLSGGINHMWNLVEIDGLWYHIDVTQDDPLVDRKAMVGHDRALLSSTQLKKITDDNGNAAYSGFSVSGYKVGLKYDDAPWKASLGAIANIDGVMYYVSEKNLVDETGNVIHKNLDGGDGYWNITETAVYKGRIFTGACEFNGILYFNTDEGIYSYNPKTKEKEIVLEKTGICGIYTDKNVLIYNEPDGSGSFKESGRITLGDIKLCTPYVEEGTSVVRLYNDSGFPVWIISKGDSIKIKVAKEGVVKAEFENGNEQEIFIWYDDLRPVTDNMTLK